MDVKRGCSMRAQPRLRVTFAVLLLALLPLVCGGCLLSPPELVEEPNSVGQIFQLVLRVAFVRPWLLLPTLWTGPDVIREGGRDFVSGFNLTFQYGVLVFLVGGLHVSLGLALLSLFKSGVLGRIGAVFALYGLFIWLTCLIASLLGLLL